MNPNGKCHCGSGKKFKKCCQYGEVKVDTTSDIPDVGVIVDDPEFEADVARFVAMQQEDRFKEKYKYVQVALTDQGLEMIRGTLMPIYPTDTIRYSKNKH